MSATEEIKKLLKSDKLILGTELTLKSLKRGELERVFLSNNCPSNIRDDIEHYTKLSNTEVVEVGMPNDQLGDLCKKPFSISIIGLLK